MLFENKFDDEFINIDILRSQNSIQYNFFMSNTISKLVSSN